jgi:uncharacterized protein YbjT (DUF2867 family)
MKILVTGGTGVIGAGAIPELLSRGHEVRLLSRRADCDVKEFPRGVEPFAADVTNPESLRGAADGCSVVVHITGIVDERPPEITYERVNVQGTQNTLAEAERAGVARFVFISSLGADRGQSDYHQSKLHAEELVRQWSREWVILRPGNVYGPADEVISLLLKLVRSLPVVPVVDSGDQPFQPIWFEDLGRAIAEAVTQTHISGQTLELAGNEVTTTRDVLDRLASLTDRAPAKFSVPSALTSAATKLTETFPSLEKVIEKSGLRMPISSSRLQMLLEGNVIEGAHRNALKNVLGVTPTPLQDGLQILADDLPELLPDEGVGAMERKQFWADIENARLSATELIMELRQRIAEVMPIEFAAEHGAAEMVNPGATFTAAIPGRGHIQVRVAKVTSDSITFVTVEGHPLAGTLAFRALPVSSGALRFLVEIHARAANIVDWLGMRTVGRFAQAMNWRGVVLRVVDLSGGEAPNGVQHSSEILEQAEAENVSRDIAATVTAK